MAKKSSPKLRTTKLKLKSNTSWLQKHWIALAVIVAFAGIGTYIIGTSSAATTWEVSGLGYQCPTLPTLRYGSTGDCVKSLQVGLNNRYGNIKLLYCLAWSPLVVDGNYGTNTTNAVKRFQNDFSTTGKKLAIDGIVGPATWDKFLNDCLVFSDPALVGQYDGKSGTTIKAGYLCGS